MKKVVVALTLILSVMLVIACASKPVTPQTPEEEAYHAIYQKYQDNLILDGASTYTVKSGDTLAQIARSHYPSGLYFPLIMLASRDVVLDPDKILPGMKLTLPDLQKNLDDTGAKDSIKSFLVEIAKLEDERNRPRDAEALTELADSL